MPAASFLSAVRRPSFGLLLLVLLSFVALGGAACAKRETPVEEGIRTQTLLIGNRAEPADLDPHVVAAFTDQNIQMALFEGLAAYDERTAQAVPAAAERWEVSSDGLTWTFHLRDGLLWSNGDPLVADDFVRSFRRALMPAVACPYAYLYSPVKNADAFNAGKITDPVALGFAAPDPRTVVITLAQPTPNFPLFVALPCWQPINPRVLARFNALDKREPGWTRPGNLVGNGPFILAEWKSDDRIVVLKNPRYWDAARTKLERLVFFPIENPGVEERSFRTGQLHITGGLASSKTATYRDQASSRLRIDPFLRVLYMQFNTGRPPFGSPKVRRALSLAVDRAALARVVYQGTAQPAPNFIPPGCGDYQPHARLDSDFEAARRLLAEAGHPGGRGLPALAVKVWHEPSYVQIVETLQAMWKKELGVEITIEPLEQKSLFQVLQARDYSLAIFGWIADFADPASFLKVFASDGASNWTGWSDPGYDGLLHQAARTPDATTRMEIFQKAEALLLADAPIIPLIFSNKTYLIHPAVKGWEPAPIGFHRFQHIRLER